MRSPGSFALLQATQTEHFGILLGVELIGEMHRMERGPMTRCRGLFGTTGLFALLFTWGAAPLPAQTGSAKKRSEEHTSELQSQSNLVCRLLLEKKKTDNH